MTFNDNETIDTNKSRFTMRKTALFLMVTLMSTSDNTGSAFMQQQSTNVLSVHTALHSTSDGNGAMSLPPDLQQAYEGKNAARKKFGLKPMPIHEFLELQTQVAQMEQEHAAKLQEVQYQKQQQQQKPQGMSFGNFAKNIFEKATEDECISNLDCESPKVCCDLGVKKMCCANGMLQVNHQYALEPIPVDMRD